jgi:hypothetical protein
MDLLNILDSGPPEGWTSPHVAPCLAGKKARSSCPSSCSQSTQIDTEATLEDRLGAWLLRKDVDTSQVWNPSQLI